MIFYNRHVNLICNRNVALFVRSLKKETRLLPHCFYETLHILIAELEDGKSFTRRRSVERTALCLLLIIFVIDSLKRLLDAGRWGGLVSTKN